MGVVGEHMDHHSIQAEEEAPTLSSMSVERQLE
jgi:hypothetical protein